MMLCIFIVDAFCGFLLLCKLIMTPSDVAVANDRLWINWSKKYRQNDPMKNDAWLIGATTIVPLPGTVCIDFFSLEFLYFLSEKLVWILNRFCLATKFYIKWRKYDNWILYFNMLVKFEEIWYNLQKHRRLNVNHK